MTTLLPPSSVKPDRTSLGENSKGELQVEMPSETFIGDFETDYGDWSQTAGGSGTSLVDEAYRGSQSVEFNAYQVPDQAIERAFDASNAQSFIFYYKIQNAEDDGLEVSLDSNVEFSVTPSGQTSWKKVEIDLSPYSGETIVEARCTSNNDSSGSVITVDAFKVVKKPRTGLSGAGN